jgi:hypothetical protein
MANCFQVQSLDYQPFSPYFEMTDQQLAEVNAVRMTVTESPGTPCRVSLQDAELGEEVILVPFEHLPSRSPYRSGGAIFVRKGARRTNLAKDQLPTMLRSRMLSVRAYNSAGFIIDAAVTPGAEAEAVIGAFLDNSETDFVHIHFAKPGCFACSVVRA